MSYIWIDAGWIPVTYPEENCRGVEDMGDPLSIPLVDLIHDLGYQTGWSCEGHATHDNECKAMCIGIIASYQKVTDLSERILEELGKTTCLWSPLERMEVQRNEHWKDIEAYSLLFYPKEDFPMLNESTPYFMVSVHRGEVKHGKVVLKYPKEENKAICLETNRWLLFGHLYQALKKLNSAK